MASITPKTRGLSRDDEVSLGRTIQDPAQTPAARLAARNRLVSANLSLVGAVMRRFQVTGMAIDHDDLRSEGYIALMRAAERWQPDLPSPTTGQPVRFSTLATGYIFKHIAREAITQGHVIAIPQAPGTHLARYRRLLNGRNDRQLTKDEVMQALGLNAYDVAKLMDAARAAAIRQDQDPVHGTSASLGVSVGGAAGPSLSLAHLIADHRRPAVDVSVGDEDERRVLMQRIWQAALHLSDKHRGIFCSYFGLGCPKQTNQEIANQYGCTHQAVKFIVQTCFKRIRDVLSRPRGAGRKALLKLRWRGERTPVAFEYLNTAAILVGWSAPLTRAQQRICERLLCGPATAAQCCPGMTPSGASYTLRTLMRAGYIQPVRTSCGPSSGCYVTYRLTGLLVKRGPDGGVIEPPGSEEDESVLAGSHC